MLSTKTPSPISSSQGRLVLVRMEKSDIDSVQGWFSDPETCQLAFGVKSPSEELSRLRTEYIQDLRKDRSGVLMIREQHAPQTGDPLGFLRFKIFKRAKARCARIGILLGQPESRGKGFGREAVQTLLNYLFETEALALVELDTADFNIKAQNCFEACGFEVSHASEVIDIHNDWKEQRLVMTLDKQRWLTHRDGSTDRP